MAPAPFAISGKVTLKGRTEHWGVRVHLTRLSGTGRVALPTKTLKQGWWTVSALGPGTVYEVKAVRNGWRFTPESYVVSDAASSLDFVGELDISGDATRPAGAAAPVAVGTAAEPDAATVAVPGAAVSTPPADGGSTPPTSAAAAPPAGAARAPAATDTSTAPAPATVVALPAAAVREPAGADALAPAAPPTAAPPQPSAGIAGGQEPGGPAGVPPATKPRSAAAMADTAAATTGASAVTADATSTVPAASASEAATAAEPSAAAPVEPPAAAEPSVAVGLPAAPASALAGDIATSERAKTTAVAVQPSRPDTATPGHWLAAGFVPGATFLFPLDGRSARELTYPGTVESDALQAGDAGTDAAARPAAGPSNTYGAAGRVEFGGRSDHASVTVTFRRVVGSGVLPEPVQSAADGSWRAVGFEAGTVYAAVPTLAGWRFIPPAQQFGGVTGASGMVCAAVPAE